MTAEPNFALNHMNAPRLDCGSFIDLAASLGCTGVELRNDLADKKLTDRPFLDGEAPETIREYVRRKGLRLLGLSEVYGFNDWSEEMRARVVLLIGQARASGAESISLIPRNDGIAASDSERQGNLRAALREILPMLQEADMIALVEPLGFTTSSLRSKSEAVEAIEAVGGTHRFKTRARHVPSPSRRRRPDLSGTHRYRPHLRRRRPVAGSRRNAGRPSRPRRRE